MASKQTRKAGANGRAASKRLRKVDDLFDEKNLLHGRFHTDKVHAWFQRRHKRGARLVDDDGYYRHNDHEWKIPYGVRIALHQRLLHCQIATKLPYFATWVSPKTGRRLRKYFGSFPQAIKFVAERAQYVDPDAAVVSRHGYDIPAKLRGKFPRRMGPKKRMHYWCPRCMAPRVMLRTGEVFWAAKKVWNAQKGRYEFRDRKLALTKCAVCGGTNRDGRFRRSNQPYEVRKIKKGVRKIKKRRKRG